MSYGLHVIKAPSGRYIFVGSVPRTLLGWREPTKSDVMGQRVDFETGLAHYTLTFNTEQEAIDAAIKAGFEVRS